MKPSSLALSLSVAIVALPVAAHAYDLRTTDNGDVIRWADGQVTWVINEACSPNLGDASYIRAIRDAHETWSDEESELQWHYGGLTSDATHGWIRGGTNVNNVIWEDEAWPYGEEALALTIVTFNTANGDVLDADILINGVDHVTWATDSRSGYHDVNNVVTHEVGHALGLGHSAHRDATMWSSAAPGETSKRSLADDDIAGLFALYAVEIETPVEPSPSPAPDPAPDPTPDPADDPAPANPGSGHIPSDDPPATPSDDPSDDPADAPSDDERADAPRGWAAAGDEPAGEEPERTPNGSVRTDGWGSPAAPTPARITLHCAVSGPSRPVGSAGWIGLVVLGGLFAGAWRRGRR